MTPEDAFIGLRHRAPDFIRLIRGAFDNGMTAADMKRTVVAKVFRHRAEAFPGERALVEAAIDYMAATPESGRVNWHVKHGRWNWAEFDPIPKDGPSRLNALADEPRRSQLTLNF